MLIAQISDLHVVEAGALAMSEMDTNACLARCVARLNGFQPRPDLVLATGDLINNGTAIQYAALRALLAPLDIPVYLLPGNHDDRTELRAAFPDHSYLPPGDGFVQYVLENYPVRIIALDTMVPGETGGALCQERLAWLADRLAEAPDRPTLIAMHHPPFDTGIGFMDRIGLDGREALAHLLEFYPRVERVICGHVHRPVQSRFGGTVASIAPSTAHQIPLALNETQPDAWLREPAAFHLHLWRPDQGVVTHTVYIEATATPRPFD